MRRTRTLEGPVVLIAIGVALLLWNLGYFPRDWGRWWPIVLILLGIVAIVIRAREPAPTLPEPVTPGSPAPAVTSRPRRRLGGGLFLIGLGAAFLVSDAIGRQTFPALVLIAIGLASFLNRSW